jgi:uncharacterized protein YndB with AHSA1/START domain
MISAGFGSGTTMAAELVLHLERVLPAPRALVFRMHAEPDLLAQWWGPKGFTAPSLELDLCVGGRYRITMQPPEGDRFVLSGEFGEVDFGTRLQPFATDVRRALHEQGWTESLDRLEELIKTRDWP